jgi:hypothetical protein
MIRIPGSNVTVYGRALETRPTEHADAWLHHPITLELYRSLEAVRVAWDAHKIYGHWFAIGDVIEPRAEYKNRHALPGKFRYTGFVDFAPGTILNVGQCSPLFGGAGKGYQAEYLEGPLPRVALSRATWVDYAGTA